MNGGKKSVRRYLIHELKEGIRPTPTYPAVFLFFIIHN